MKGKLILNKETLPLILIYSARRLFKMDLFDKKPIAIASVNELYNTVDIDFDSYYDILSIDPYAFNDLKNLTFLD